MTTALILGAAVWADGPSPTLLRRTRHAANLYAQGRVTHLIPCGGLGTHPPTEAEAMRHILLAEGVPDSAITLEDRSTTTATNIRNARALLSETKVIIISDSTHLPRACLMARRLGLEPQGSAPDWRQGRRSHQIKQALREISAYAYYWLRFH